MMNKFLNKNLKAIFPLLVILGVFFARPVFAGTLSCSVTTAGSCAGTVIYRMSGSTNAHAELPGQSNVNYDGNVVCCAGVTGLSNSCSAPSAIALKLSAVTNAHAEKNTSSNFANNACISVPTGGTITVGYVTDPTTCTGAGYDTTLGSISGDTNAHVGDATAYPRKICAAATPAGLAITGILVSSVFDTTGLSTSAGYNSIMWKGTLGGPGFNEGKVRFQIAAAEAFTGPWNYFGGITCGSSDWFDSFGPDNPIELKGATCSASWNNKRYFRYKIQICSNDCVSLGMHSPTVDDVIVNWSP